MEGDVTILLPASKTAFSLSRHLIESICIHQVILLMNSKYNHMYLACFLKCVSDPPFFFLISNGSMRRQYQATALLLLLALSMILSV